MDDRYEEAIKALFGPDAEFREGQKEAIVDLVEEKRRVLLVQATGWGKSLVYFFATRFLREDRLASGREKGLTLVVSPLLALMRNQKEALAADGLNIETVNSGNRDDWRRIRKRMTSAENGVDLLLISPERFSNDEFKTEWLPEVMHRVSLFVIDEAHCISEWGHDFRPDYQRLRQIVRELPQGTSLALTTATANDRVVEDVVELFRGDEAELVVRRGSLARDSLVLARRKVPSTAERYALIECWIRSIQRELSVGGRGGLGGIVYVRTRRAAERLADWLELRGFKTAAYMGGGRYGSDSEAGGPSNEDIEELLSTNKLEVVVATTALGMGYDKPDLAFVFHFNRPQSVIEYYQQVGRAGRQIGKAYGILFEGSEDADINEYFRRTAVPTEVMFNDVIAAVEESGDSGAKKKDIEQKVNQRASKIEHVLKHLSVMEPAPIDRDGSFYIRNFAVEFVRDTEKDAGLLRARESEEEEMLDYMEHEGCLMEKLTKHLNDPWAVPCGRCQNCAEVQLLSAECAGFDEAVEDAQRFLKKGWGIIEPRKQWPSSAQIPDVFSDSDLFEGKFNIPSDARNEEGRYLVKWGDGPLGELAKEGKYGKESGGRFSDELIERAILLVKKEWKRKPQAEWVTCVPSVNFPDLVPGLARKIAKALGLKFVECFSAKDNGTAQKEQNNSSHQLKNLLLRFERSEKKVPSGPVLLIDDFVDSRWTFTYIGGLLREAGCKTVFPFAIGDTSNG